VHREIFYAAPENVKKEYLYLFGEEVHHLRRVLRKKEGDIVWAVDGIGASYEVELINITDQKAECRILKTTKMAGEPEAEVTLALGVLKGERFDIAVEKATEIGVRRIVPFISENSTAHATHAKISRWRRKSLSAMKQSTRSILPEITETKKFSDLFKMECESEYRFIAHQSDVSRILDIRNSPNSNTAKSVFVIVGPEGGFSEGEVAEAVNHGYIPIALGKRRLRSETAAIVITTLILFQLGEIK